jgi:FkbM family methyltransferase
MKTEVFLKMKNIIKFNLKSILGNFNCKVIFPGEHTPRGLEPFVVEYYMRISKGILHVGAHIGSEAAFYDGLEKPVLWIEGNPNVLERLNQNVSKYRNQKVLNVLVGDEDGESEIYLTDNEVSSSALRISDIGQIEFGIQETKSIKVNSKTLDSIAQEVAIETYDFWVIDVQGFEMAVLRGGWQTLKLAKFLLIECSTEKYYNYMALYPEIRKALVSIGFYPVLSQRGKHFEMLFINSKLSV